MNSTIQTISPLRQRFLDDMRMRKLSPKTQSGQAISTSKLPARASDHYQLPSCLCGSERGAGISRHGKDLPSCLCGSERQRA